MAVSNLLISICSNIAEDDVNDAVLLLSPKAAKNNDLVNVLEPLVNRISVSAMRFANGLVDEKGISPKEAAQTLLSDE